MKEEENNFRSIMEISTYKDQEENQKTDGGTRC